MLITFSRIHTYTQTFIIIYTYSVTLTSYTSFAAIGRVYVSYSRKPMGGSFDPLQVRGLKLIVPGQVGDHERAEMLDEILP